MSMKAFLTKKRVTILSTLLTVAVIFVATGLMLESMLEGTWVFLCEIEDLPILDEIMQVGDSMFLVDEGESIRVLTSNDGCNWSEVEPPAPDHDIWSCSAVQFKVPGGKLGIAWEETDPDTDKKPRSTFFWSTFDGSAWSDPGFLFHRDENAGVEDAMMLENGALLLLWNEPLVHYIEKDHGTVKVTGCEVTYRAYVNSDELLIERVIEPEDPYLCHTDGFSFVDDGERIWCVFEYGGAGTYSLYRSWSEDGKQWSPPEPFPVPDPISDNVFLTPQGEIAVIDFDYGGKTLFLLKSTDWENWSRESLLKTEKGVLQAEITEGKNGTMWGIIDVGGILDINSESFFIQPSEESKQKYEETMHITKILDYLALLFVVLTAVFALSWIQKRSSCNDKL
ncbi:MAG: hypothetical protein HXS48_00175 [Theionarchaea archaeon]|nr:hypothetical protein [Theionarchaea archaeon]